MEIVAETSGPIAGKLPIYLGPPDQTAIIAYSDRGSETYDDPDNLSSLYGDASRRFLETLTFRREDRFVLDLGCGTGFGFDVIGARFEPEDLVGIGVDPAAGMLARARAKYKGMSRFRFVSGEAEAIPLPERSVDRVISTLAMHWVQDMPAAAAEVRRVIRPDGMADLFLIANEDGFVFKRAVLAAMRKHVGFAQIIRAAGVVQRLRAEQLKTIFETVFDGFDVTVEEHRQEISAAIDEHMSWWRARSMPVVATVPDLDAFEASLRAELEALAVDGHVTFDAAFLRVRIVPSAQPSTMERRS